MSDNKKDVEMKDTTAADAKTAEDDKKVPEPADPFFGTYIIDKLMPFCRIQKGYGVA